MSPLGRAFINRYSFSSRKYRLQKLDNSVIVAGVVVVLLLGSRSRVITVFTINDPIEFVFEDRWMTISVGQNCMCVYGTQPDVYKMFPNSSELIENI